MTGRVHANDKIKGALSKDNTHLKPAEAVEFPDDEPPFVFIPISMRGSNESQ